MKKANNKAHSQLNFLNEDLIEGNVIVITASLLNETGAIKS